MDKKLILHFDARNTLFVSDFNSRLTTEKALNTYISGLVWGSIVDGEWKIQHESISTNRPDDSLISFYKYMESSMVKGPNDRPKLRETLGKFTEENGKQFHSLCVKHLKLLEWRYAYHKDLTVKGSTGQLYHYILPTFFKTIHILYQKKRDFAIIIRTFGLDIPPILCAIKAFLNGEHPMYPEKINIDFCSSENKLTVLHDNQYEYRYRMCNNNEIKTTCHEREIVDHWNSINGIAAVKDDFDYWCKNDYHFSASKPLWINYNLKSSEKTYHHIFFDDCIRPRDDDSIVHLREIRSNNGYNDNTELFLQNSTILSPSDTEKYVNINLVQSDLLECIINCNYFIERIELCEKNFNKTYY